MATSNQPDDDNDFTTSPPISPMKAKEPTCKLILGQT